MPVKSSFCAITVFDKLEAFDNGATSYLNCDAAEIAVFYKRKGKTLLSINYSFITTALKTLGPLGVKTAASFETWVAAYLPTMATEEIYVLYYNAYHS